MISQTKLMDSNSTTPMENSRFEILSPPESSIHFDRHRRSHLKSETFRTLVRILNHCYDYSQRSLPTPIIQDKPQLVNGSNEIGKETGKEVHDELVGGNCMERDNVPMLEDMVVDESTKVNNIKGEGSNCVQMVMDELKHMKSVEGTEELVADHCINLSTLSVDNNQTGNEIVESVDRQENYVALENFLLEEYGDVDQLLVDNDGQPSSPIVVESCFDKGIINGTFEKGSNGEDKTCEEKMSSFKTEELEQRELHQKDNELEKSVCISSKMVSPISTGGNEEMEDGEIYGDLGLCDQSIELLEDVVALEEENIGRGQISEDVMIKEIVTSMEQKRWDEQDTISNLHNLDIADEIEEYSIENEVSDRIDVERKYKMASPGKRVEDKKADVYNWMPEAGRNKNQGDGSKVALNGLKPCPGDITLHRDSSEENANKKGGIISSKKDAGVSNKKKRSGSSEAKKEKEKRRKRLKRAEMNRELGVKRLKLQPVLKPKIIKICDHHLKGRCRKGDQCSFSHDAVPLTKSTPCCHFARKSCMKGSDCPFDHELAKYPCDNFVSKGLCIRGDACMFSHKMPVKDGSLTTSHVCNRDFTPILPGSTDSKKQPNIYNTTPWNMDTGVHPCKNTNENVAETVLKPPAHPPKGMSFLSFGKSPLNGSPKLKQGGSSPKGNNIKVGNQMNPSELSAVQSLNEVQKITPPAVAPKGINFFSFGKAPFDYSSSKKQAAFPSDSEKGIVTTSLNNSSKMKQVSLPLKGGFCIGNQHEQSALETIQDMHEMPKKYAPELATQGINPFSLCNDPSDDSRIRQQTRLPINKISVMQRQAASELGNKLDCLSSGESSGQLSDGHRKMASSSQKALLSTLAFAARYESELKIK